MPAANFIDARNLGLGPVVRGTGFGMDEAAVAIGTVDKGLVAHL